LAFYFHGVLKYLIQSKTGKVALRKGKLSYKKEQTDTFSDIESEQNYSNGLWDT